MRINPIQYNFSNIHKGKFAQKQPHYFGEMANDSASFQGKTIPKELRNLDFSKLNQNSPEILEIINTGTLAQILKFKPQNSDKLYAIKRLYPHKITQPQDGLIPKKHKSLFEQLRQEVRIYEKLEGVNGVPQLFLHNIGDKRNRLNNYLVTSWADGIVPTKEGAIYDTELVAKHLPQIFDTLGQLDKKGVEHGDLWAGNILLSTSLNGGINILDFNKSKIFGSTKQYQKTNLDDFKKRFLNIFLSDVYHRYGKENFLEMYKTCLNYEKNFFIQKKSFYVNNKNAGKYFTDKINSLNTIISNPNLLENEGIKTIYDSNNYWAKVMKIRENQGDFRYYVERAAKLEAENPQIIKGEV